MGDLLKQGVQWLAQMRAAHCASPVTYRRGTEEDEVLATRGQTEYEVEDDLGLRITVQVVDFLIAVEAFPYDEPLAGDQIVADGVVYEVMSLSGQGHFRWSDPYRKTLRIHAKEMGAE